MGEGASIPEEKSALESTLPFIEKIERARTELLDLSTRNRLLNTPRSGKARTIEVVDELAVAMYQTLVLEEKRFTFSPGRIEQEEINEELREDTDGVSRPDYLLGQPDVELDDQGRVASHWDTRLSTRMTSAGLQKRLLDLYIDARTLQEEQGVNILYLAIGYLRWRDPNTPQVDRYAPLVLVPTVLERSNARERFHLRWSGDDIEANLSLQAMLLRAHGLQLPEIADFEALDVDAYMTAVEALIDGKEHWAVLRNDAVLGLFSFAKFMMYRDLDPDQWAHVGGFEAIETIRNVVSDGFATSDLAKEDAELDVLIPPKDALHVLPSDSSQSLVIHDARRGSHLLVQGPPGTGKSQTISNIIAAAVADGKKVLFVAEKMAALEVVKRRLDSAGVGVACVELHSNKANKRTLLEELKRTWQLGAPRCEDGNALFGRLEEARDGLNEHVSKLHLPHVPSQLTPYVVLGHLVRLKRLGYSTNALKLEDAARWVPHEKDERFSLVQDLSARISRMGTPVEHAWFGIANEGLLPNDRDRWIEVIRSLVERLNKWEEFTLRLAAKLEMQRPRHFGDVRSLHHRADRLVAAPGIGSDAFLSPLWDSGARAQALVDAVRSTGHLIAQLAAFAPAEVLSEDWASHEAALQDLSPNFTQRGELISIAVTFEALQRANPDLLRLVKVFGEADLLTLDSAQKLVAMANCASTMPDMEREAVVSHVWDRGIESIIELIEAVEKVQEAQLALVSFFREPAWSADLNEARCHLAAMRGSWLRFLSGKWRRANRLVRSLCASSRRHSDDAVLQALDQLISAQGALRRIAERDAQGLAAFGAKWERQRSSTSFLRGVVEWMRALRPLGAGVRTRLADLADRELAASLGKRLLPTLIQIRSTLTPIHDALMATQRNPWHGEILVGRIPLELLQEKVAAWKTAADRCRLMHEPHHNSVSDLLQRIAVITRARTAAKTLNEMDEDGRSAFGQLWRGAQSTLEDLQRAETWMSENSALRELAARTSNAQALLKGAEQAMAYGDAVLSGVCELFMGLNYQGNGFVTKDPVQVTTERLLVQLKRWEASPEGLPEWVTFLARANEARRKGLASIVDRLVSGDLAPDQSAPTFDLSYFETILAGMISRWPELARFDGMKHSQLVEKFADLDRQRMSFAVRQVLRAHHASLPQSGGVAGPTGVLRAEMARQRRHMPIRQLMHRCATAIQAVKPVFMMSPLSVAQFLPPGAVKFDLLVIDEASQVQPVDALGSIARAKQMIVVGDEKQLPPTRFFSRILADDREDDDQGAAPADIESILGLCKARGLPERMLRWHYRSRHQSLIAVSNSQFYESKLFIVPSPYNDEAGMGLRLHHVPENVYDRGETSTNAKEATLVAAAVLQHARTAPEQSLGVAAFSTQQRRAITDELELLRRKHPETESFFANHPNEPFFVKSLESVQGDERDVIYISVGYGRDSHGQMTMNFGPLTKEGGERRLNVLISRAKRRCEIFSSITDADIDLERAGGKGVAAFKLFLHYARTGRLSMVVQSDDEVSAVFERQVAESLKERGYNVHSRIGSAGCFVDLAVADPQFPGRYVLGIECDGVSYRDARSARDRDHLRKWVLEDQGWSIHRIWSADWFHRPQAEIERLTASIERSKANLDASPDQAARAVPAEINTVERADAVEINLVAAEETVTADKYEEAKFSAPTTRYELHELPSGLMASVVEKVVKVEGPIHRSEIVARVRSLWGLQRAGGRIQAAVEAGISHAVSQNKIEEFATDFLSMPGQEIRVRDRSDVTSLALRRPDYLPPQEIDAALHATVKENLGARLEELVLCVSRKFGFRNTSAQLREVIEARAKRLIEVGTLVRRGDDVVLAG